MIEILKQITWYFDEKNTGEDAFCGQLTKCSYKGIIFYVRENLLWGTRQILQLHAPAMYWLDIARTIREKDPLQRAIITAKDFTPEWAEQQFEIENHES